MSWVSEGLLELGFMQIDDDDFEYYLPECTIAYDTRHGDVYIHDGHGSCKVLGNLPTPKQVQVLIKALEI